MKHKILLILAMTGLSAGVFGQGTVVFQNAVGGVGGRVYDGTTNIPFSGAMGLELFYGPVGDTAAQLLALNTGVVFNTTINAGIFFDGTTVVTSGPAGNGSGDPTQNVELLITGWLGGATNFQAAQIQNGQYGIALSLPFSNPTGAGGGVPGAPPANLVNWLPNNPLITTIPEPGVIVLGGLGAAALLLFRRSVVRVRGAKR
jgi:hypothetical protein